MPCNCEPQPVCSFMTRVIKIDRFDMNGVSHVEVAIPKDARVNMDGNRLNVLVGHEMIAFFSEVSQFTDDSVVTL